MSGIPSGSLILGLLILSPLPTASAQAPAPARTPPATTRQDRVEVVATRIPEVPEPAV